MPHTHELNGTEDIVRTIFFSPEHDILAASADDGKLRVYDIHRGSEPQDVKGLSISHRSTLEMRNSLEGDPVTFSFDDLGYLITWLIDPLQGVESLFIDDALSLTSVAKLNKSRIILGTSHGELIIVPHIQGNDLKVCDRVQTVPRAHVMHICV